MKAVIVLGAFFVFFYFVVLGVVERTGGLRGLVEGARAERVVRNSTIFATALFALIWWAFGPPMFNW